MRGKHTAPRRGLFWRVYVVYLLALLILGGALLFVLWRSLESYQAAADAETARQETARLQREQEQREARAPQLALESFLNGADAAYWTGEWFRLHPQDPEPPSEAESVIRGIMEQADFSAYKDLSYTPEEPVYLLKTEDTDFARIWLMGGGTDWSVARTELLLEGSSAAALETLATAGVYWGDTLLTAAGEPYGHFPLAERGYELVDPVLYQRVEISGTLAQPDLQVVPAPGETIIDSEADGFPVLLYEGEGRDRAMEESVAFVRTVLRYFMSGGSGTRKNLDRCLAYVRKGSAAYETLNASYDAIIWNHTYQDQDVEEVEAAPPIAWGSNCFSVDVRFHARASVDGETVDYAMGTYRLYYFEDSRGFGITELVFE